MHLNGAERFKNVNNNIVYSSTMTETSNRLVDMDKGNVERIEHVSNCT